jgi:hypothetical protein
MKRLLLMTVALGSVLSASQSAFAQLTSSDTQRFVVAVPRNVLITAPADILIVHDETNADQVFPPQQWYVRGNVITGVTTTFDVTQPFTHSFVPATYRDARIDLAIASTLGPAVWTVGTASDQTNYGAGDNTATVQIASNFVGHAFVDLTVTFLTVDFSQVLAGDYDTFVVGTVTEN